jgi:hypothetical protein
LPHEFHDSFCAEANPLQVNFVEVDFVSAGVIGVDFVILQGVPEGAMEWD